MASSISMVSTFRNKAKNYYISCDYENSSFWFEKCLILSESKEYDLAYYLLSLINLRRFHHALKVVEDSLKNKLILTKCLHENCVDFLCCPLWIRHIICSCLIEIQKPLEALALLQNIPHYYIKYDSNTKSKNCESEPYTSYTNENFFESTPNLSQAVNSTNKLQFNTLASNFISRFNNKFSTPINKSSPKLADCLNSPDNKVISEINFVNTEYDPLKRDFASLLSEALYIKASIYEHIGNDIEAKLVYCQALMIDPFNIKCAQQVLEKRRVEKEEKIEFIKKLYSIHSMNESSKMALHFIDLCAGNKKSFDENSSISKDMYNKFQSESVDLLRWNALINYEDKHYGSCAKLTDSILLKTSYEEPNTIIYRSMALCMLADEISLHKMTNKLFSIIKTNHSNIICNQNSTTMLPLVSSLWFATALTFIASSNIVDEALKCLTKSAYPETSNDDALDIKSVTLSLSFKSTSYPWHYFWSGIVAQILGDKEQSIASFVSSSNLQPGSVHGWIQLAKIHIQKSEYKLAIVFLESASKIKPNDAFILNEIGFCLYHIQKYDESLLFLNKAKKCLRTISVQKNDITIAIAINIGQVLRKKGKLKDSYDFLSLFINHSSSFNHVLYKTYAFLCDMNGHHHLAQNFYIQCIISNNIPDKSSNNDSTEHNKRVHDNFCNLMLEKSLKINEQ